MNFDVTHVVDLVDLLQMNDDIAIVGGRCLAAVETGDGSDCVCAAIHG